MEQTTLDKRTKDSKQARDKFWEMVSLEGVGALLMVIAIFIAISGFITVFDERTWFNFTSEFYANVSSELASIVITIFILDKLNVRRDEKQRKLTLFRQVKSRSNGVAIDAIDQIRHEKYWDDMLKYFKNFVQKSDLRNVLWHGADLSNINLKGAFLSLANLNNANLEDAQLEGASLFKANLQGVNLVNANLAKVDLISADLKGANLFQANLQGANLGDAKLQNAYLFVAQLQDADLQDANLRHANLGNSNLKGSILRYTHLEGTDLSNASLQHTNMYGVKCSPDTILPDGKQWTPGVDWSDYGAVHLDWKEWIAYRKKHGLDR